MKLPTGQAPQRTRNLNNMQKKPEFSQLMTPKASPVTQDWRSTSTFEDYMKVNPITTLHRFTQVIEAMYMFGCVLKTDYTTTHFCQNDGWVTEGYPKGLRLEIGTDAKKVLTAEFLQSEPKMTVRPSWIKKGQSCVFHLQRVSSNVISHIDTYRLVIEGE